MDKKTQKWILAAIAAVVLLLITIIWLVLGSKSNIDTGGNGDDFDYGATEGNIIEQNGSNMRNVVSIMLHQGDVELGKNILDDLSNRIIYVQAMFEANGASNYGNYAIDKNEFMASYKEVFLEDENLSDNLETFSTCPENDSQYCWFVSARNDVEYEFLKGESMENTYSGVYEKYIGDDEPIQGTYEFVFEKVEGNTYIKSIKLD